MADSGGYDRVTTRIDDLRAETRSWVESTNNEALGLWRGSGISFIRSMFGHDVLLVQATPFNDNTIIIEFPITGVEDAIKPLREACHWAD
jgi:type VI secretion system protein VasI